MNIMKIAEPSKLNQQGSETRNTTQKNKHNTPAETTNGRHRESENKNNSRDM
jgi:hypothetical protein